MPIASWNEVNQAEDLLPVRPEDQPTVVNDKTPDYSDVVSAAFHLANPVANTAVGRIVGQYWENSVDVATGKQPKGYPAPPPRPDITPVSGYTPYADPRELLGYEDHFAAFSTSESPNETQRIKQDINNQRALEDIVRRDGWRGMATVFAAGMTDPLTIASMFVPLAPELEAANVTGKIGTLSRTKRVAAGMTGLGALTAVQEGILTSQQPDRPLGESLYNIAGTAFLGGALGMTLASRFSKEEFEALGAKLKDEGINGIPGQNPSLNPGGSAGAARVGDNTSLWDESIATGGRAISNIMAHWHPLNVVLNSGSRDAKVLAQEISIVRPMLNKNLRGINTAESVEIRSNAETAKRDMAVVSTSKQMYEDYVQRVGDKAISWNDFNEAVYDALNVNDVHDIPEVQKLAQWTRKFEFDPDKQAAIKAGMLPEDTHLISDPSYAPVVYDHPAINADEVGFRDAITKEFTEKPKVLEGVSADEVAAHKGVLDETVTAHKEATAAVDKVQVTKEQAYRDVSTHQAKSDAIDQKLSELESKRQYLHEDMSGSTPEQIAKEQTKIDREIERIKEQGHAAESKLQEAKTAAAEADKAVMDAKNAAREAKATVKEAKTVHEQAKKNKAPESQYRDPAEIKNDVQNAIDHIMGGVRGTADLGRISNPKPTKERVMSWDYATRRPYVVRDFQQVMRRYHRSMIPQLEMRKTFGSADLNNEVEAVRQNYKNAMANATDGAEIDRLRKEMNNVTNALYGLRDKVLNQVGPKGNNALHLARAGRLVRSWNYLTMPGSHVLSAMSDYAQLVRKYGLTNTTKATVHFLTSVDANRIARTTAQKAGTAVSNYLGEHSGTFADIGGELTNIGKIDKGMDWATRGFTKVTLMGAWNTTMQSLASMLEQDFLVSMARLAKDNKLTGYKLGVVGQHNMTTDDLRVILEQFEKHGENDGLSILHTSLWDKEAQDVARRTENSIVSNASSITHNLTAADMPLFMTGEMARMLIQFKSFGIGAVNRIMIPTMQGVAHGDLKSINGLVLMLAIGAWSDYLKAVATGREPDLTPAHIMGAAIKWSGIAAYLPEFIGVPMAFMPTLDRKQLPFLQAVAGSRSSGNESPSALLGGPTAGTVDRLFKAGHFLTTLAAEKAGVPVQRPTAAGLHDLTQLIPYRTVFYGSRLANATEGKLADSLDLQGAKHQSFYDTLTESRPPK